MPPPILPAHKLGDRDSQTSWSRAWRAQASKTPPITQLASAGTLDGDPVQLATGDDLMRTTVAWTSEVLVSVYVSAVCSALRYALRASRASRA